MSNTTGLADLVAEIKLASRNIEAGDARNAKRLDSMAANIDDLYRKVGRPGGFRDDCDTDERKSVIGLCQINKSLVAEGDATAADYMRGATEIQTAMRARQGLKALFRSGDLNHIEPEFRNALSSFSFGNNGFLLAPEMSNRVLSCLVDPTDVAGLVDSITISGPSIRFLIDNARMVEASWACVSNCFSNNPQPDLNEGLGELDIQPETLRYVVCATSDLLADAALTLRPGFWTKSAGVSAPRSTPRSCWVTGSGSRSGCSIRTVAYQFVKFRPRLEASGRLVDAGVRICAPRGAALRTSSASSAQLVDLAA